MQSKVIILRNITSWLSFSLSPSLFFMCVCVFCLFCLSVCCFFFISLCLVSLMQYVGPIKRFLNLSFFHESFLYLTSIFHPNCMWNSTFFPHFCKRQKSINMRKWAFPSSFIFLFYSPSLHFQKFRKVQWIWTSFSHFLFLHLIQLLFLISMQKILS